MYVDFKTLFIYFPCILVFHHLFRNPLIFSLIKHLLKGGTSDSPSQAAHTNNVKPADSGKTIANDVKTKVKDSVQGNGDNTHTARASSNVKPADSSKPSDKPDKGKLSDSIKSSIKSSIRGT